VKSDLTMDEVRSKQALGYLVSSCSWRPYFRSGYGLKQVLGISIRHMQWQKVLATKFRNACSPRRIYIYIYGVVHPPPSSPANVGERGKAIFPMGSPPAVWLGQVASDPGSLLYTHRAENIIEFSLNPPYYLSVQSGMGCCPHLRAHAPPRLT
jgi:hypothetical protein